MLSRVGTVRNVEHVPREVMYALLIGPRIANLVLWRRDRAARRLAGASPHEHSKGDKEPEKATAHHHEGALGGGPGSAEASGHDGCKHDGSHSHFVTPRVSHQRLR